MSALVAVLSLLGTLALLLVPGGVLLVPFTLGGFLLALTGVLGGLGNRTVAQHDPRMTRAAGETPRERLVPMAPVLLRRLRHEVRQDAD